MLSAATICAISFWLWSVPLRSFHLKLDDFVYIIRSRSASSPLSQLFTPHNGHIVPLFLLETHVLARTAGTLEALPNALAWASCATLFLAIAAIGHLVAWETGNAGSGLAAMAAVGFTSVLGPAIVWYSAGQALAAGTMIVVMLAALQAWRAHGWWWLMVPAVTATIAAPLFWTAGYISGLVGAVYLWADGRRSCRRLAALPLFVSGATFFLVRGPLSRVFTAPADVHEPPLRLAVQLGPAIAHSAQAVCEALVFNNLGLDSSTSASQGLVLLALLLGIWARAKRRFDLSGRPLLAPINPLEAAGAAMVAAGFGMIFAVRGTEASFDGLRALGWYDAIPELGAVIFVSGWWSGRLKSPPSCTITPLVRTELLSLVVSAGVMLVLQTPRIGRVIFEYDGLSAPYGPIRAKRTPAELADQARKQRHALAALDQIEKRAIEQGLGRSEVHVSAIQVVVPGMPTTSRGIGPAELLNLPDHPKLTPNGDH